MDGSPHDRDSATWIQARAAARPNPAEGLGLSDLIDEAQALRGGTADEAPRLPRRMPKPRLPVAAMPEDAAGKPGHPPHGPPEAGPFTLDGSLDEATPLDPLPARLIPKD